MKEYLKDIVSGKGLVEEESRFYSGFAVTLKTAYGEVILTSSSVENLAIQAQLLMPGDFNIDRKMVQDISIFSSKKVTKAT